MLIAIATGIALTGALVFAYNKFGRPKKPLSQYGVFGSVSYSDSTPILRNYRVAEDDKLVDCYIPGAETIFDNFMVSVQKNGTRNCFGTRRIIQVIKEEKFVRGEKKVWEYLHLSSFEWETYQEVAERVLNFGCGLLQLGLQSGDNLALYSETRAEWHLTAQGSFSQNIVVLTVYANLGLEPILHAFNEGEVKVIVTNGALLRGLLPVLESVPSVKHIIYTDSVTEDIKKKYEDKGVHLHSFLEIEEKGKRFPVPPNPSKSSDEVALIMYTSGTTGMPKGVMLTHKNLLSTMSAAFQIVTIFPGDVHLSYLPLAHILALIIDCALLCRGASVGFGNPRSLSTAAVRNCKGDLEELRPNFFAGVPSVLDKIKQGIEAKIKASSPLVQFLFKYAYDCKKAALLEGKDTPIWNALVFKKFKTALGGRVRFVISGGAPLSANCCEFLSVCFGVPICQGYGLTETSGGSSLTEPDSMDIHARSSGAPFSCAEFKLVDVPEMNYTHDQVPPTGEVWIRGNSVCKGYYKNLEKTKEEFTEDGWFKTGDIGKILPDGVVTIIDRKKNLVKPPHGEYIAPERLESIYKNCPFVDNLMIYASPKYYEVIALVCPNKKNLTDWAISQKMDEHDWEKICQNKNVENAVLEGLNNVWKKANLRSIERVSAVKLFPMEWTPENGWLTAAMKVRRNEIHKIQADLIEEIYAELAKKQSSD